MNTIPVNLKDLSISNHFNFNGILIMIKKQYYFTSPAIIYLIVVFSVRLYGQQPLIVDAGRDTNYCVDADSMIFGGNPTAYGGVKPYSYKWTAYSKTSMKPLSLFYDYNLNNIANPSIKPYQIMFNDFAIIKVTVTDSIGTVVLDSSIVGFSKIKEKHLMFCSKNATNDSAQLSRCNVYQGIPPYTYHWTPETGLSNPCIENTKAKPDSTTSYILEISDSINCSTEDLMEVYVNENPFSTAIKNSEFSKTLNLYYNGKYLIFPEKIYGTVQICNINGVTVYKGIINSDRLDISKIPVSKGFYLYKIFVNPGRIIRGKIIGNYCIKN